MGYLGIMAFTADPTVRQATALASVGADGLTAIERGKLEDKFMAGPSEGAWSMLDAWLDAGRAA
jgi:hypothetical protein